MKMNQLRIVKNLRVNNHHCWGPIILTNISYGQPTTHLEELGTSSKMKILISSSFSSFFFSFFCKHFFSRRQRWFPFTVRLVCNRRIKTNRTLKPDSPKKTSDRSSCYLLIESKSQNATLITSFSLQKKTGFFSFKKSCSQSIKVPFQWKTKIYLAKFIPIQRKSWFSGKRSFILSNLFIYS